MQSFQKSLFHGQKIPHLSAVSTHNPAFPPDSPTASQPTISTFKRPEKWGFYCLIEVLKTLSGSWREPWEQQLQSIEPVALVFLSFSHLLQLSESGQDALKSTSDYGDRNGKYIKPPENHSLWVFQGSWRWRSPGRTCTTMLWWPPWMVCTCWLFLELVGAARFSRHTCVAFREKFMSWNKKGFTLVFMDFCSKKIWCGKRRALPAGGQAEGAAANRGGSADGSTQRWDGLLSALSPFFLDSFFFFYFRFSVSFFFSATLLLLTSAVTGSLC